MSTYSPADPAIVVEQTCSGAFLVTVRPILSHRDLERAYPAAWRAWEWADLLSHETGWPLIDRTEMAA